MVRVMNTRLRQDFRTLVMKCKTRYGITQKAAEENCEWWLERMANMYQTAEVRCMRRQLLEDVIGRPGQGRLSAYSGEDWETRWGPVFARYDVAEDAEMEARLGIAA